MSDHYSRGQLGSITLVDETNPVRQGVNDYLRALVVRNYSYRTIELRGRHLRDFCDWLDEQGVTQFHEITRPTLERYQHWLHSQPMPGGRARAISTQAQRLIAIRMFCRHLADSEQLGSDPSAHIHLPRQERPLPKPVLTPDEVERVFSQPDLTTAWGLRDRAILETLFATGIRRQELAWLSIDDIDKDSHTLTVRCGKGKRGRMVPISTRAIAWIERYLTVRPLPADPSEADVLFLTSRGHMCGLVHLSRSVTAYIRAAGLTKQASCHSFRATTATMMLEGGADIRFVQQMLGHAQITTTQLYTRVSIGALQRVYARTHPSAQEGPGLRWIADPTVGSGG